MKRGSGIRQSRVHPTPLLRVFVLLISDIFSLWPTLPWKTQTWYFPPLMPSFHVQLKAQWSTYLVFAVLPSLQSLVSLQLSRHDHSANIQHHWQLKPCFHLISLDVTKSCRGIRDDTPCPDITEVIQHAETKTWQKFQAYKTIPEPLCSWQGETGTGPAKHIPLCRSFTASNRWTSPTCSLAGFCLRR